MQHDDLVAVFPKKQRHRCLEQARLRGDLVPHLIAAHFHPVERREDRGAGLQAHAVACRIRLPAGVELKLLLMRVPFAPAGRCHFCWCAGAGKETTSVGGDLHLELVLWPAIQEDPDPNTAPHCRLGVAADLDVPIR
jgi:hypothetical protein